MWQQHRNKLRGSEWRKNLVSETLAMTWLLVSHGLVWVFLKLLISWEQSAQFRPKHSSADRNVCWWERSEERDRTGWSWQKAYDNSDSCSLKLYMTCWTSRVMGKTTSGASVFLLLTLNPRHLNCDSTRIKENMANEPPEDYLYNDTMDVNKLWGNLE